jgi:hypothetical protein
MLGEGGFLFFPLFLFLSFSFSLGLILFCFFGG